ncbi:GrdX family protein [Inediibacterium massiliense]|uniref:GrdX family protein n=1 Tax=Inediibacterium massiliense TaxID=1658111 RepID=UPI0006B4E347|nr:GrdX family protein [Inediibacterium massiliense]
MKETIITNNPKVFEGNQGKTDIIYLEDVPYLSVLLLARDKIHKGYKLLTHPLSGSVKPNETPYKSIAITKEKGEVDIDSIKIIEESIQTVQKFLRTKKTPCWTKKILKDFQLIDYCLIQSAIESMKQF